MMLGERFLGRGARNRWRFLNIISICLSYLSLRDDCLGGLTVHSAAPGCGGCTWILFKRGLSSRGRQLNSPRRPPPVGSWPVIRSKKTLFSHTTCRSGNAASRSVGTRGVRIRPMRVLSYVKCTSPSSRPTLWTLLAIHANEHVDRVVRLKISWVAIVFAKYRRPIPRSLGRFQKLCFAFLRSIS